MQLLITLLAGLLAAAAAWPLNTVFLRLGARRSVTMLAPVVEESAKTGIALFIGASVPGTHFVFGLVEAVYDYLTPPRSGITTWLTSLLGHLGFGLLTLYLARLTGSFFGGWAGTIIAHLAWNNVVYKFSGDN